MTGPTSVAISAGSPIAQLRHRARQHRQEPVGDVVLDVEQAQRRAALPGAVEGGGQDVATTCSASAEESTIIAF